MTVIPTKMNANELESQAALLDHVMHRLSRATFLQREGKIVSFFSAFRNFRRSSSWQLKTDFRSNKPS